MIKVSLIVLAGLAAGRLLRHHSAAMRHSVLAAAIACAAALPLLEAVAPSWEIRPVTSSSIAVGSGLTSGIAAVAPGADIAQQPLQPLRQLADRVSVHQWIVPVWMIGLALSLLVLFVGFGRLAWIASHSVRLRNGRWVELAEEIAPRYGLARVDLLQSAHASLLVVWGLLRPQVLLPASARDWPEERMRVVLCHELAHVRRRDWAVQILAEVLRCVYWFNPLLWIACRKLRQESEQACDDVVLGLGIEGTDYATHLLEVARAVKQHRPTFVPELPAPAMVRPSSLERRVRAMLKKRIDRTPPTRAARLVTIVGMLGVTLLVAGFGAAAQTLARFSGAVVDPMNSGVPRVTLVLTNLQTEAKYEVRSDPAGQFEFVGLPAGEYLLEARYPGFATFTGSITVSGQSIERNLALQLGTLQETVTVSVSQSAPAERAQAAPPPRRVEREAVACQPGPAGGNLRPPKKLRDVRPVYARHLVDAGIEGTVILDGRIGPDGSIGQIDVIDSAHPELTLAAVEAVRQWEFDSTLLNCVPVEVAIRVNVGFSGR